MTTFPRTQLELEARMYSTGEAKERGKMEGAEDSGYADRNPYAQELMRRFVEPLALSITEAVNITGQVRTKAAALLADLDPWAAAYVAVRACINHILHGSGTHPTTRTLSQAIGQTVYAESYLSKFNELEPDLFFILTQEIERRKTKSISKKLSTFVENARTRGLRFTQWGPGSRDSVGAFVIKRLVDEGMLLMAEPQTRNGPSTFVEVFIHPDVLDLIDNIKDHVSLLSPAFGPCIEPPRDWLGMAGGGWHSTEMQRCQPFVVKAPARSREYLLERWPVGSGNAPETHQIDPGAPNGGRPLPTPLAALNALQRTAWRVNTPVLAVAEQLPRIQETDEIVLDNVDKTKPTRPDWLDEIGDDAERTPEQVKDFAEYKKQLAVWHTRRKLSTSKRYRMMSAIQTATFYSHYEQFWYVYFFDSRGRMYPQSLGIHPQGSDLQKGLLEFAEGKPLNSPGAVHWFLIQGANKFGFDKATLQERADWHKDKVDFIRAYAEHPLDNRGWLEADNPFQFLAWCMEFVAWKADPHGFHSHLPIGMDGSCSGLQHFSAMLRDEVGGKATNLTNNEQMEDIYRRVAEAATVRMLDYRPEDSERDLVNIWRSVGINRKVTKRPTMTTPYGITKRSAIKYVVEDYLRGNPAFPASKAYKLAHMVMEWVWPAIGDIVVAARAAMDYLTQAAKVILKSGEDMIQWDSPSGFPATQVYAAVNFLRISTELYGHARIRVAVENEEEDLSKHATAFAPNFVHSMDAAHLHLTTARMVRENPGVSLAMIHDDFGTHAADAPALYDVLREEFYRMYLVHDVLLDLHSKYPVTPPPPLQGNLDLAEVLASEFIFS